MARREIPLAEWIAAGVGAALVAATLGYLGWRAATQDGAPPSVEVRAQSVEPVDGGYLVRIRASNSGGRTAAGVKVEGKLRGAAGDIETAEMTFPYLPARSAREGGLFFANDPRRHKLELRPKGYESP